MYTTILTEWSIKKLAKRIEINSMANIYLTAISKTKRNFCMVNFKNELDEEKLRYQVKPKMIIKFL